MKIAVLQFNPQLGAVARNIQHVDQLLSTKESTDIDLLVLPEMAFSGYNFPSLDAIRPYLEPTTSGPTTQWAQRTARQKHCTVIVGYPEIASETGADGRRYTRHFNATVSVGPDGNVLFNYRKSFLYYTDETWAEEGFRGLEMCAESAEKSGNHDKDEKNGRHNLHGSTDNPGQPIERDPFYIGPLGPLGLVGHGICMDINPYRFESESPEYQFARAMLGQKVPLVILSMAWLTRLTVEQTVERAERPDMDTIAYWLGRFWPFVRAPPAEPIVVVFANRCGSEAGTLDPVRPEHDDDETGEAGHRLRPSIRTDGEDRVAYAGSSCVMRFQAGSVRLWEHCVGRRQGEVGMLGKGEEGLLVVDTDMPASFILQRKAG